eukprot:gene2446-3021_t
MVNCINSQTCDDVPPIDSVITNPNCTSATPNSYVPGKLSIKNYLSYTYFGLVPFVPVEVSGSGIGGKFEFTLAKDVIYTAIFGNKACNKTTTFSITTGPSFVTVPAKCTGGKGKIIYNNNADPGPTVNVTIVRPKIPSETSTFSKLAEENVSIGLPVGTYQVTVTSPSSNVLSCSAPVNIFPISKKVPIYEIIPPFCGNSDGSVYIRNHAEYTEMILRNDSMNQHAEAGKFSGLRDGIYLLDVVSNECGSQTLLIRIDFSPASVLFESLPSCPAKLKLSLDPPLTGGVFKYGDVVCEDDIVLPRDSEGNTYVQYYGACNFSSAIPAKFQVRVKPPVQYSIKHSDQCQENATITLKYDSNLLSGLKIYGPGGEEIAIGQDKTLQGKYGDKFYIEHDCYSDNIVISIDTPYPIFDYVDLKENGTCADKYGIKVYNYLDFPDFYLREERSPNRLPLNGMFSNLVYGRTYEMIYQYGGNTSKCNENQIQIYQQDINVITLVSIDVVGNPYCNNKTVAIDYVLDGPAGQVIKKGDIFGINEHTNFRQLPYKKGDCETSFNWNFPPFTIMNPEPTFETVKSANCQYSTDGIIRIIAPSKLEIDFILFNGRNATLTRTTNSDIQIKDVTPGNTVLKVYYKPGASICPPYEFTKNIPYSIDFTISYTATPPDDCANANGKLVINDYNQLMSTMLIDSNGKQYTTSTSSPGTYLNLPTDRYRFTFINSPISCTGLLNLEIDPPFGSGVQSRIVEKPVCNSPSSTEGIIEFRAYDNTNQNLDISTNLNFEKRILTSGKYSYVGYSGVNEYKVVSGNCSFYPMVQVPYEDPQIRYRPVFPYGCSGVGVIEVYSENPRKVKFNQPNGLELSTDRYFVNITDYDTTINVQWNKFCKIPLEINFPKQKATPPTLNSLYPPNCGKVDGKVVIANYQDYILSYNDYPFRGPHLKNLFEHFIPLYYTDITNQCSDEMEISFDYYPSNLKYTIKNETCHGSFNGELSIDGSTSSDLYFHINPLDQDQTHPQSSGTFSWITSGKFLIKQYSLSNPLCVHQEIIVFAGSEPDYLFNNYGSCNADGVINARISLPGIDEAQYSINELSNFTTTGTFTGLQIGDYLINATVTEPICKRILQPTKVSIGNSTIESVVDVSVCQTIKITPKVYRPTYKVIVTNGTDFSKEYDSPTQITLVDLKNGTYSVSIFTEACSLNQTYEVIECVIIPTPQPTETPPIQSSEEQEDKNNVGLIVGLTVGLVAAAGIIAGALTFFLKRRQTITPNVIDKPVEMNTVSVFQGGKVTKIDEF